MGNDRGWLLGKLFDEQVEELEERLARYVKEQDSSISRDTYLKICKELGKEPDPQKMPLDISEFPSEMQVAFFVFSLLPDVWEGMSGTYMGKDWSSLTEMLNIFEIEDRRSTVYLMKLYENVIVQFRAKKEEGKRKAEERKQKAKVAASSVRK